MVIFEAIRILIMFALAFTAGILITPFVYKLLQKFNFRKSNIREAIYDLHKEKSNTFTMGGLIVWGTVLGLALFFSFLNYWVGGFAEYLNFVNRAETYLPLAALFLAGVVGFFDDFLGIKGVGSEGGGLTISKRILLYTAVAAVGAWWFYFKLGWDILYVPFIGNIAIGWWYIPFFIFILLATAFSTNQTDGLDGLAPGTLFFAFAALAVVAFTLQRYDLAVMNAAILGALLAFLWFNIYPAKFFMGDIGSMSLGITLGVMAMLTNTSLFLPFFGMVFVIESGSTILQIASKKFFGKKIFLIAPIHHHFERLGWHESQITMRFWIVSIVSVMLGLALFFLARFV